MSTENNVHYCNYTSQSYVQIACTGINEYASSVIADSVYQTDDGSLYTFIEEKVTCPLCKSYIEHQKIKETQKVIDV